MKKIVSLLAALVGLLAVSRAALAHCTVIEPVTGVCLATVPDPPPGWQACVSPGSPANGWIQVFTTTGYGGYCFETSLKNNVVNDFYAYDLSVRSVKSRKSTEGGLASQQLFSGTNLGGTAWTIPYGDSSSLPFVPRSLKLWHW